jgi:hypothetical protein
VLLVALVLVAGCSSSKGVVVPPLASLAQDATTASDYADAACVRLRLVAQGVTADSAASVVRQELAAARVLAAAALRRDGRWAGLSGGIAALDEAVTADDGAAAGPALQVALRECSGS